MRLSRRAFVMALLVAMSALTLSGKANPESDARKAIQSAYDKGDTAGEKLDLEGMYAYYSPDYTGIDSSGKTKTLADEKAEGKVAMAIMKSMKLKSVITKFTLKGNEATVLVKQHADIVLMKSGAKKPSKMVEDATSEDLWNKGPKGWMLMHSKTLTEKVTINGKAVAQ